MESLAMAFDYLFGCHHRNLSRVFTLDGETYKVCCDCGARFSYSLANMSIERRTHAPQLAVPHHAHSFGNTRIWEY
jgi:hypothetical protein